MYHHHHHGRERKKVKEKFWKEEESDSPVKASHSFIPLSNSTGLHSWVGRERESKVKLKRSKDKIQKVCARFLHHNLDHHRHHHPSIYLSSFLIHFSSSSSSWSNFSNCSSFTIKSRVNSVCLPVSLSSLFPSLLKWDTSSMIHTKSKKKVEREREGVGRETSKKKFDEKKFWRKRKALLKEEREETVTVFWRRERKEYILFFLGGKRNCKNQHSHNSNWIQTRNTVVYFE